MVLSQDLDKKGIKIKKSYQNNICLRKRKKNIIDQRRILLIKESTSGKELNL